MFILTFLFSICMHAFPSNARNESVYYSNVTPVVKITKKTKPTLLQSLCERNTTGSFLTFYSALFISNFMQQRQCNLEKRMLLKCDTCFDRIRQHKVHLYKIVNMWVALAWMSSVTYDALMRICSFLNLITSHTSL